MKSMLICIFVIQAIEEMKEQSAENVERLAYALISENDLIVSHVGWNFLEHIIK